MISPPTLENVGKSIAPSSILVGSHKIAYPHSFRDVVKFTIGIPFPGTSIHEAPSLEAPLVVESFEEEFFSQSVDWYAYLMAYGRVL